MFTRWTFKRESSTVSGTHLVSSANVFLIAVDVHPLGNVGRLLLQGHQDVARLVVKTCRVRHKHKLMLLSIVSLRQTAAADRNRAAILQEHQDEEHLWRSRRIQSGGWCRGRPSGSPHWHWRLSRRLEGSSRFWQQSLQRQTNNTLLSSLPPTHSLTQSSEPRSSVQNTSQFWSRDCPILLIVTQY